MNSKNTWIWVASAACLFAFIVFFERRLRPLPEGPGRILANLRVADVTSLEILPARQLPIRMVCTNLEWWLVEPVVFPAQTAGVEDLLATLANLVPAFYLTPAELKNRSKANEEFGFNPPQVSLVINQGDAESRLWIGARTPPGDMVYAQVVGNEGIYAVDAGLLKMIPRSANDWRDPAPVNLSRIRFDRLVVTNAGKVLDLQYNPTNKLWRMGFPNDARADSPKVEEALLQLQGLRVHDFVSDDPKADLDAYGLQTPEFSMAFKLGTNTPLLLGFGKSPTNNPGQIYARRVGSSSVVTVSRDALDPWSAARNFRDFFDRHLVSSASAPDLIEVEVQDQDSFALQREPDKTWRVTPQGFPADAMLVAGVISNMAVMQASDIAKYSVTEFDLPGFGLAPRPSRRYSLKTVGASATGNPTNALIAQLDFGVKEDKVYAVCAGENFVYAVNPSDLRLLPSASWQMRERRIWNFAAGDAVRITSRRDGKTRELIRKGTDSWSFAPGSQGILDEVVITAIEETVRRFGELSAAAWLERGDQNRAGFGFTPEGWQISVELKDGRKFSVEFGGTAPSGLPCAQTVLDGQPWLFEFPLRTYQLALTYLAVSPNLP